MDYVIGFLLGMAAVWLWPRLRRQFGQKPKQEDAAASAVPLISVAADAGPSPTTPAEPQSLSSRLTALFNAIDPETNTSAHPRELIANPKFAEARRLLADKSVPSPSCATTP